MQAGKQNDAKPGAILIVETKGAGTKIRYRTVPLGSCAFFRCLLAHPDRLAPVARKL